MIKSSASGVVSILAAVVVRVPAVDLRGTACVLRLILLMAIFHSLASAHLRSKAIACANDEDRLKWCFADYWFDSVLSTCIERVCASDEQLFVVRGNGWWKWYVLAWECLVRFGGGDECEMYAAGRFMIVRLLASFLLLSAGSVDFGVVVVRHRVSVDDDGRLRVGRKGCSGRM
eukprot:4949294-Amphidinium_carterae.1